jgi:hypothetical protein
MRDWRPPALITNGGSGEAAAQKSLGHNPRNLSLKDRALKVRFNLGLLLARPFVESPLVAK